MRSMKKILTAILTTVLLANVSGCQTAPPDPAPALQTLTVKSEPASESDRTTVDMSAALEQIIAGINFKPTVSTIKKFVIKDEHDSQTISPHAKQESSYASTSSVEDTDMQGTESKTINPTPVPKQPEHRAQRHHDSYRESNSHSTISGYTNSCAHTRATGTHTYTSRSNPGAGRRGALLRHRLLDRLRTKLCPGPGPAAGEQRGRLLGQPHRGRAAQHLS